VPVRRLPGGHGLKYSGGRLEVFPYWDPAPSARDVQWVTPEELSQFPGLLRRAVEQTMECGNGQIGIFLSGGFDSVSVAACAADIASQRGWPAPHAISLIFPDDPESHIQQEVAGSLGLPQTFGYLEEYRKGSLLLARMIEMAAACPSPPLHNFKPPYFDLLERARSLGCKIVLTGEGGDEWLTVTPAYSADLIRGGDLRGLARMLQTGMRSWDLELLPCIRNILWTHGLRPVLRDWGWQAAPALGRRRRQSLVAGAIPAWLAPDDALRRELIERFETWNLPRQRDSYYFDSLIESMVHPLTPISAEERFYRDAAAGVPTLHPYWSRPLVEFLIRTPPELLNRGGRSKALVRGEMERRFPGLGFSKQKKITSAELCRELYREAPLVWRDLGGARLLGELGIVDAAPYEHLLDESSQSHQLGRLHQRWYGAGVEGWIRAHA